MQTRRSTIAGLAAAFLLLPATAACQATGAQPGGAGATASTSASAAPVDPVKQALLDSTKAISEGNFRFAMTGAGVETSGVVHQPSRSARLTTRAGAAEAPSAFSFDLIYVEPDGWVKLDLAGLGGQSGLGQITADKYLHLDQTRIKDIKGLRFDFQHVDPAGSQALTRAITDVKKTGDGTYTGTIDLEKATDAGMVDQAAIQALGGQARTLPFQARLDEQGRLSELTVQLPANGANAARELKVTYSDYGAAVPPQKPSASEVAEAPAELYDLFNK